MAGKGARRVPYAFGALHLEEMTPREGSEPSLHHIQVKRTARYATFGVPGADIREVWIVCHGYAQLARYFIERFRVIAAPHRLIVAPEALNHYYLDGGFRGASSRVGATWMTTEDRESEIADYVAYLDEVRREIFRSVPRDRCRLTVLGFSQGVATVARWVAAGNAEADRVILWAGSLPAELAPEGAKRLMGNGRYLTVVAGDADQFITPKVLEAQMATLAELGVTVEVTRYSGKHEIESSTLERLANTE